MLSKHYSSTVQVKSVDGALEGTGSLVFDVQNRKVFCCYSQRATPKTLNAYMTELNKHTTNKFKLVAFNATDKQGLPIYHTNCVLSVLKDHYMVCSETVSEKAEVMSELKDKRIIDLSMKVMEQFAGNTLMVRNKWNEHCVIISSTAWKALSARHRQELECYRVIKCDIGTIEDIGGGSARCMVAELF